MPHGPVSPTDSRSITLHDDPSVWRVTGKRSALGRSILDERQAGHAILVDTHHPYEFAVEPEALTELARLIRRAWDEQVTGWPRSKSPRISYGIEVWGVDPLERDSSVVIDSAYLVIHGGKRPACVIDCPAEVSALIERQLLASGWLDSKHALGRA